MLNRMVHLFYHSAMQDVPKALWTGWAIILVVIVVATAVVTRLIVRRQQSADLVSTLRTELREERRRHARVESVHEQKLAVYREAAIKQRVVELFDEAKKMDFVVRR
jgi:hypothetical protein